jgi:hypothetical protein
MGEKGDDGSTNADASVDSKVARLIDTYELGEETGAQLERRWTAEGDERESLRTLADRFNKQVLAAAVNSAGMSTVDGEVDNLYRLLTSPDVSSGNRTEVRRRLERNGVDVDQLKRDFVTYQAIRSYLKDVRGAEYEDKSGDDDGHVEQSVETIQRLQARTRSVAEKHLDRLNSGGDIVVGEHQLFVDVSVFCEDCQNQYELVELLESGGCDCGRNGP